MPPAQMDFKNKTVLITRASSGIGYSLAKLLPKENCSLALFSRSYGKLQSLVDEIKSDGGIAKAYRCDVAKPDAVKNIFDAVKKDFGKIDIAVLNAGISSRTEIKNYSGGSPGQAGIVNDEIRRLKTLHKKKVYAVVDEMCASGAYYIAVAADEIYVDKASLVGSIGVLVDGFGVSGLMDKLDVERRLLTAGDNKGMLDPFSPENEKHKAYAQALIDQVHQQFIKVVKDGRGKRLKETPETCSGLFWNGPRRPCDRAWPTSSATSTSIAREVVKAEEVIDYTPKENVAERLAKRFGAGVGAGAVKALRQLAPIR